MHNFFPISIHPHFCIIVTLSMFVLPIPLVFGWMIAAAIHEICHLSMLLFLKVKVLSVSVGATGALIKTEPMSPVQELLSALAGPVGALLLLFCLRTMPYIAISAAIQSFYNLLPVYPLDGGRAVKCAIVCFVGEDKAAKTSNVLSSVVLIFVLMCGIWMSYYYQLGVLPIVFPLVPLLGTAWKNTLQREKNNCRI